MLYKQLGIEGSRNKGYYFGDLDYEGISIWHILMENENISLAIPFYQALIKKKTYKGKNESKKE